LVSAVIADGPPRRVLEVAADGEIELAVPDLALAELERVLVDKLGLEREAFVHIRALIDELPGGTVPTPARSEEVSGDPDDDRILAAANAAGAEVLVSGDSRHLLPLGEVGKMRILRPQELLAELTS
jgi:uncharacterized protein